MILPESALPNLLIVDKQLIRSYRSWITSVEGQKFEICWSADILGSDPKLQSLDLRATVWLDGIQIAGGVLEAESIAKGEYASISGQLIAADKERPCEFGTLALTG